MLKNYGHIKDSRNMLIEEKVALFLNILAHDEKTRIIKHRLKRSEETINRNFHKVLKAVLHLHEVLFKTPEPVLENCEDKKWKWFKVPLSYTTYQLYNSTIYIIFISQLTFNPLKSLELSRSIRWNFYEAENIRKK